MIRINKIVSGELSIEEAIDKHYEEHSQHIQPEELLEAKRVVEKKWDDMRNVLRDEVVLW
jgi:hypothetical protein